jgi:hypothetical protein
MQVINRDLLASTAHRILVADLISHGNKLSELHTIALRTLVDAMADYTVKSDVGRKAVALPTGMGKTSAVVAFILALEELGYRVPVAVAASKVKALSNLKTELLVRGVPEERLGLKHHADPEQVRREDLLPSTGNDDRLYMLVTHSKVSRGADFALFGRHKGIDRALMLWDETLMRTQAGGIDARDLRAASRALPAYEATDTVQVAAAEFLAECVALIDAELAGLREAGDPEGHGATVVLPERTAADLLAYSKAIGSSRLARPYVTIVRDLFDIAAEPLQVLAVGTSAGIIWTRECIPELLRNVLVLDASYPIRTLVKLDSTLTEVPTFDSGDLKRFDQVKVVQFMAAGGRDRITKEGANVTREVADVIASSWSAAQGVLVFSFKVRSKTDRDQLADLKAALRGRGIDPTETTPDGRPKLVGLTFGQETSLNGYEYCDVVALAGVLHRSELDVAAAVKAQQGHLQSATPGWMVQQVVQSEVCHVVYQALSRGSCRRVNNGMAEPMTAYLIHRSDKLQGTLEAVMPGAQWERRQPTYLKPSNAEDVSDDMASAINEYLRKVPVGTDSVSCRSVAKALEVADRQATKKAFTRGGAIVESLGSGWAKVGQHFKRGACRYGFTSQA